MAPHRSLLLLLSALLLAGCGGSSQVGSAPQQQPTPTGDPVVAQYADTSLTLSDFESAYAETVGGRASATDSSLAAYQSFLEQYVNYRLKVRAARDARLDTLTAVQQDVYSYRQKMARSRLMESEVYEPVVRRLYERRQQEVDVSHILVQIPSGQDTVEAYHRIRSIADSLDQGVSFGALAYRNSDDPTARKEGAQGYRGHLGYLRAGQLPEPFEDRMYTLNPGAVSDIFRTRYGYHIIKVHDRRPAQSAVELSHIMLRPNGDSTALRRMLDSLRTEIVERGAHFAELAEKHSEDPRTASNGGALGEVQPSDLPPALRNAAVELDSVGAVSDVVKSQYGYHLLKLTGREKQQPFEEAYKTLKKQVADQPRVERQRTSFAHDIRTEEGVNVDTTRILESAALPSPDSLARPLLAWADSTTGPGPFVVTLGDSTYTLRQLARHLTQTDGGARMSVGELIEDFLNTKAFQYAGVQLEERDPSFASMMQEYRDGALLFRYMQDSVWTAAAQDTAGLRDTFDEHRDRYRFPERIRTVALRAPADSLLHPYKQMQQDTGTLERTVQAARGDSLVSVDTTFVTDRSLEIYRPVQSVEDGETVGPTFHQNESLLLIRDTRLPPRQKTFEEARSSVVQDHQEQYEERLIRRLRDRYDVETFPERLRQAFDDSSTAASTP